VGSEGNDAPLHQLMALTVLRILVRVYAQAELYAGKIGSPAAERELRMLGEMAVHGGAALGWSSRALAVWNAARAGRSDAEIAVQCGVPVSDVPQWIKDADTFLARLEHRSHQQLHVDAPFAVSATGALPVANEESDEPPH
jgi:hypothetical protein